MTEPEITQPVPVDDIPNEATTEETATSEADAEPPPEPWTPERVSEWNAYYDFYVTLAALLLVFMVSCNYVTDTHFWLHLKTGQLMAEQGSPVTTDVFSYTESGRPWTNIAWLFQWAQAALYNAVLGIVPVNPSDPTANRASADQIAVGTLGALNALVRVLTAWLLLKIRHRGPGAWWSAVVVTLALGFTFHPAYGLLMGGIAGPASITPRTWGLLLFAFEMYILYGAIFLGRRWSLWLLVPTFLLWANIDSSFLTGLVVFAAAAVGLWFDRNILADLVARPVVTDEESGDSVAEMKASPPRLARPATALIIAAICASVCLINPYTYRAYVSAIHPYVALTEPAGKITTVDVLSFFGPWVREHSGPQWYLLPAFYIGVVALGLGSFFLNARRFSWSRFLPFLVMSVIWAIFMNAARSSRWFSRPLSRPTVRNGITIRSVPKADWERAGHSGRPGAVWSLSRSFFSWSG